MTAAPEGAPSFVVRAVSVESTRQLRRDVLRPGRELSAVAAMEAPDAVCVGAFCGELLVACGMIVPGEDGWRVRGMAAVDAWRGRGAGALVLAALVERARAAGARRVWCNARTPARALYERAGFVAVGEEFELAGIGPHFVMELAL